MSQIYQQTYLIDAWGNRRIDAAQTNGGVNNLAVTIPTVNGVPTTNRLNELSYDFGGNVTNDATAGGSGALTFDGANRMTRAITGSLTSHYVYDAGGQRVRRIINGAETWQVFGFDGELLAEYPVASGAPSANAQREYGYRGGDMLVVAGCDVARWLIKDQIGTPRMLADVTGTLANIKRHDYLPYGEEVPVALRSGTYGYAADCLRQDFTTYERDDETGLDYARARYYASKQGRFISVDPMESSADGVDPQSWNRYAYVGNHPLELTDPSGLIWVHKGDRYEWINRGLTDAEVAAGWRIVTEFVVWTGDGYAALNPLRNEKQLFFATKFQARNALFGMQSATISEANASDGGLSPYRTTDGAGDVAMTISAGGAIKKIGTVLIGKIVARQVAKQTAQVTVEEVAEEIAVPKLVNFATGNNGALFREIMGHVKAVSGDGAAKAKLFEALAAQAKTLTGGGFEAVKVAAQDGANLYAGRGAEVLVISRDGVIYRGTQQAVTFIKGVAEKIDYTKFTRVN